MTIEEQQAADAQALADANARADTAEAEIKRLREEGAAKDAKAAAATIAASMPSLTISQDDLTSAVTEINKLPEAARELVLSVLRKADAQSKLAKDRLRTPAGHGATPAAGDPSGGVVTVSASEKLMAKAQAELATGQHSDLGDALMAVRKANPELAHKADTEDVKAEYEADVS